MILGKGRIMENNLTRRAMLSAGAAAVTGSIMPAASLSKRAALPWQWKELKPADVQERAYQSAWAKVA